MEVLKQRKYTTRVVTVKSNKSFLFQLINKTQLYIRKDELQRTKQSRILAAAAPQSLHYSRRSIQRHMRLNHDFHNVVVCTASATS